MREPTVGDGSAVAEKHGGSVPGALGQLFRVRPDGGNAGTMAGGRRHEYNQAYSRDGSLIAFDAMML